MLPGKKKIKNKEIKIFLILAFLVIVIGCALKKIENDYHGKYPELYSVAINSLLGARGYAQDERKYDSEITIMESDQYGRTLFFYYEGKEVSSYSLIISQESTDNYTYFYPDVNFISASENDFPQAEIEELKRKNDWDKPIVPEKCIKVEVVRKKEKGPINNNKLIELYNKALGEDAYGLSAIIFFTTDDYNRSIYLGYGKSSKRRYVVMLFNADGSYDESKCIMELTDLYRYQDELKSFKELNNWNKPY